MTRVCIVNRSLPPAYGGAEIAAYRYGERLASYGESPILIGPGDPHERPDWVVPVYVPESIAHSGFVRRLSKIAWALWPELASRRDRFDVVHIFNSAPVFNLMAVWMARLLGKPVILESSLVGSDDPVTLQKRGKGREGRRFPKYPLRYQMYSRGDAYVSKSPALARAYAGSGLPESKHILIPYAVDCDKFTPSAPAERPALRKALGLPEGPTILYVGGMNARKGVHHLLESFRNVVSEVPEARLALVGPAYKYEPEFVEGLHARTAEWGLEDHVTFVDQVVTNVHEYMRAADVFTLPSSREGLPISILESMGSGMAIVASDIPEIADSQITDGDNGLLVPFGDVPRLSEALTSVARDPGLRERLGQSARDRAVRVFSVPVVDAAYRELYARLLSGGPAAAPEGAPEPDYAAGSGNPPRGESANEESPAIDDDALESELRMGRRDSALETQLS